MWTCPPTIPQPEFRCRAASLETSQFSKRFHLLPLLQSKVSAESDTGISRQCWSWLGRAFKLTFFFSLLAFSFNFLRGFFFLSRLVLTLVCSVSLTAPVMVHPYYSCWSRSSYSNFCASLVVDGFTCPAPCNVNHGRLGLRWLGARGSPRRVKCTVLQASRRAVWTAPAKTYREHVHSMR